MTILMSMLLAASGCISARVPLSAADSSGGVLTIIGVGLVSFFGPNDAQAEASLTFASVLAALANPSFFVFVCVTLVSVGGWLFIYLAPSLRHMRAIADAANLSTALSAYAAAVCGALSQTFLKAVSVAIAHSLALAGWQEALSEVWLQPPMWVALGGLCLTAPLQLYLIDVCLASGSVTYAVPLYQALLVTLEIAAASIFFRELEHQPAQRLVGFAVGVAVATAGLVVLSRSPTTRDAAPGRDEVVDEYQAFETKDAHAERHGASRANGTAPRGRDREMV